MSHVVELSGTESVNFDPIPGGTYVVCLTDYEWKITSENAKFPGEDYVNAEFTVQEGEHEGRKLWSNVSLLPHALFTLKGIVAAHGEDPDDPNLNVDEFFKRIDNGAGGNVLAVVKIKPASDEYEARNEIKRFKPLASAVPGQTTKASTSPLP
jgi:hypothetical protein